MKSRISPGYHLFQIEVQDFGRRRYQPNQVSGFYVDRRGVHEVVEAIPKRTFLRWAKDGRKAIRKVKKFGAVISCQKVDSHIRRLEMINYLRIEPKPIVVDISAEEFIVGRDLEIEPIPKTRKIDVDST